MKTTFNNEHTINKENTKLKRRKFFIYLGISFTGLFSLSKLPMKIFRTRVENEMSGRNKSIRFNSIPEAVSRKASQESRKNG